MCNTNVTCGNCNQPLYRKNSLLEKSTLFFCNRKCQGEYKSKTKLGTDVICNNCGNIFYKKQSNITPTNFCSYKCSADYRRTSQILNCKICNKEYSVQQHRLDKSVYCSDECRHKGKQARTEKTCKFCKKSFIRQTSRIGEFCSHSCSSFYYRDKISARARQNCNLPKLYGENNPAWKGGVTMFKKKGNYKNVRYVRCPQDFSEMARKDGYVMEHRLVIAKHINRLLTRKEVVHHLDHNPNNNEFSNLLLFPCNSSHKKYEGFELKGVMGVISGLSNSL
jgi:hypothetical protein